MKTKIIEATNGPQNWGKFLVGRFDEEEWARRSVVAEGWGLLRGRGWDEGHILVLDIQTGEGAIFSPGGLASADLTKHQIWVCPLFEPFLEWLYKFLAEHKTSYHYFDLLILPDHVELPDAPFAMYGYRRQGPV